MLAQTPTLVAEYIRLGDRLLAIDSPVGWSDDFNRPNGSLGANWLLDNPINSPYSVKATIFNNQMQWDGSIITTNNQSPAAAIPIPVQASLDGQPQWAQIKFTGFVASNDAHTYIGPAAMYKGTISPATARGYFVQLTFDQCGQGCVTQGLSLRRLDQQPTPNYPTVLMPFVSGLAVGDVIRIEVIPGANQNVIRGYRNANLLFNYTDADSNRVPVQGSPAVFCSYLRTWPDGTDIVYFDDFSAGSL
jgi:hypothetical protein